MQTDLSDSSFFNHQSVMTPDGPLFTYCPFNEFNNDNFS